MNLQCPHHDTLLEQTLLAGVQADYCPRCYGLWFDAGELDRAFDEKAPEVRWVDIDLWEHPEHFRVAAGRKMCPQHRLPLYEVGYGNSKVRVDVCGLDHGAWLDRGEFRNILAFLEDTGASKALHEYASTLAQETWEVFSGPDLLKEELLDLLALLGLLRSKFALQHPDLTRFLSYLPG